MRGKRSIFAAVLVVTVLGILLCPPLFSDSTSGDDNPHTVTFYANGGTVKLNDVVTPTPYTTTMYQSLYIPGGDFFVEDTTNLYSYVYEREDYTFQGWARTPTAVNPEYYEGNVIPQSDLAVSDFKLYAVWKAVTYQATFHYQGGDMSVSIPFGATFDTEALIDEYTPPEMSATYKIVGWSTIEPTQKDAANAYLVPNGASTYSYGVKMDQKGMDLWPIYGLKLDARNQSHTITENGCYYVYGGSEEIVGNHIIVGNGSVTCSPYIYLNSLNMRKTDQSSTPYSPFVITNNATAHVTTLGDCSFTGASNIYNNNNGIGYAGINVQPGSTFIMEEGSLGTLTVTGGSVIALDHKHKNNSGAGIGANGNFSGGDDGCGTIIINGGTIDTAGGACTITKAVGSNKNDVTGGAGLGGADAEIQINGGTVTTTSGQVYRKEEGNIYVDKGASRPPIYVGDDGTYVIDPNATVILNGREDSEIVVGADIYVRLVFKANMTIGDVKMLTIGDYSINVGEMVIVRDSELRIGAELFRDGDGNYYQPEVMILTESGVFYSGTSEQRSIPTETSPDVWTDGEYWVTLTQNNVTYHSTIEAYTGNPGETPLRRITAPVGDFGSIDLYGDLTVSGNSSTYSLPVSIILNEGYQLNGIQIKTDDGSWTEVPFTWPANSNAHTIDISIPMGQNGGTANQLAFDFGRATKTVTINNHISRGTATFPSNIVTNGDTPALAPVTLGDYSVLRQTVSYNDGRTYVIHLFNDAKGNPVHLSMITVRGAIIEPIRVNDTTYQFSVDGIETDVEVNITYKMTAKVTANQASYTDHGDTVPVAVTIVDEAGNPVQGLVWYPDAVNPTKCYTYVDIGSTVLFSVTGYDHLFFGIGSVNVTFYNDSGEVINTTVIGTSVTDLYTIPNMINDTVITVNMTGVVYDVEFNSTISNTTTRYMRVADSTVITFPGVDELSSINIVKDGSSYSIGSGIPAKAGYDLTGWILLDSNGNRTGTMYAPGTQLRITGDIRLEANWSAQPHYYRINYILGDGGEFEDPDQLEGYERFSTLDSDLTVYFKTPGELNPPSDSIDAPVRAGYNFLGWTGFNGDVPNKRITIQCSSTAEDVYFTAVWEAIEVEVTYYDPINGEQIGEPVTYRFGERYTGLPIVQNFEDGVTSYSFAGWAVSYSNGVYGERITDSTRISIPDDHRIYVIWTPSNLCIVNIIIDGSRGSVIPSPNMGPGGTTIYLRIEPYAGYTATELWVNGVQQQFSGGTSVIENFPVTIPNGLSVVTVKVTFIPLDYTITMHGGVDGQTITVRHYNVESETIYITRAEVGSYQDYTFVGWTGSGIDGVETEFIMIATGTTGDLEFFEKWHKIIYEITYELNGGTNNPQNPFQYTTGFVVVLGDPTYGTYTFDGWYLNSDFSGNQISEISANTEGDLTLYAKWLFVIIDFHANGGVGDEMPTLNGRPGSVMTLPACTYTYDGRLFYMWNTEMNGSGTYYAAGADYTMPNDSATLYAIWRIIVDKESVTLQSRTYDGTTLTQQNGTGYTLSGQVSAKYYGTYTVDAALAPEYVWSDGTYDTMHNLTWNIYKRTAFIVANSVSMRQGSSSTDVPFTSEYTTIGIISSDFTITTACTLSRDTASEYINRVTCNVVNELTEDSVLVFASYNLTIIDGNVIVYDSDSSTVTVVFKNGPTSSSMGMPINEGKMITVIPRITGRKGI